jgi:hypothetical protein
LLAGLHEVALVAEAPFARAAVIDGLSVVTKLPRMSSDH